MCAFFSLSLSQSSVHIYRECAFQYLKIAAAAAAAAAVVVNFFFFFFFLLISFWPSKCLLACTCLDTCCSEGVSSFRFFSFWRKLFFAFLSFIQIYTKYQLIRLVLFCIDVENFSHGPNSKQKMNIVCTLLLSPVLFQRLHLFVHIDFQKHFRVSANFSSSLF